MAKLSIKKQREALDILKDYQGLNPYILRLKKNVYVLKKDIGEINLEFILRNYNKEPKPINKIVRLADWYAQKKQEDWGLDFLPTKIKVTTYLGDTSDFYCAYLQYRKSVNPEIYFFPKKAVLTDFLAEDYTKINVDFERYDRLSKYKRVLFPHQKEAVKFLLARKRCILADDMGLGKMEPVSSMIPTPNGFKKMGEIEVGDFVFGEDGNPHKVLAVFPHKNKEIYKVTFSDGTVSYCGLEHLWKVKTPVLEQRKQSWQVLSLKEMMERGFQYNNKTKANKGLKKTNKYKIPVCEPVQYNERDYYIDPYILGICIGDGSMCANSGIDISIPDTEKETVDNIKRLLKEGYTLSENRHSSCPRYRIKVKNAGQGNKYFSEIKRLGLNVHGNNKFIPEEYKFGSISQRLSLLRGLMDSDGSIRPGNKIGYYTNSKTLAYDVSEIVFSLGGIARVHGYEREKNGKKRTEYHVLIQIKENPFLLTRKAEKYRPTFKKYCTKYIVSAEFDRYEDAKCLMVDSSEHTYLTSKNYIVTHNTTSLSVASIEGNFDAILIICPASLKNNWKKELSFYVPERDITVIDGFNDKTKGELEKFLGYAEGKSNKTRTELLKEAKENGKWNDNRFVILNYDILDEFYNLPKTKKYTEIEAALAKSPLYQYIEGKKSLVIIDEAHNFSDTKSNRYKLVRSILKKGNPHSIYLATGTPLTNSPENLFCVLALLGEPITDDWQYYMKRYCGADEFCHPADRGKRSQISSNYIKSKGKGNWYELTDDEKKKLNDIIKKECRMILVPQPDKVENLEELRDRISHIYLRRTKEELTLPNKTIHEIFYDLTDEQQKEYERLWEEYEAEKQEELEEGKELNKNLLEGAIYRQYLSNQMIPHTEKLADEIISKGEKVVIACCFDEEIYTLKEYYGDKAVLFNGKCSLKQKDAAVESFMSDDNVKVFLGNVASASVGITLTSSCKLIFNDFSYVPADSKQMQDRVHRIGQTKDVDIYYQIFANTEYERMFDIVVRKTNIINTVIKEEKDKAK